MGAIADSLLESEPDLKLSLVPETLDEPEKGLIADAFKTTDQMELFDPVQAFTNIQKAEAVNPDEHAEAMKISPKVGLPADEVRYDLPAQRAKVKRDEFDFAKTLRENPVLSQNLTNADFAKIAADDIDTLSEVELRAKYREKAESLFKQFYKDPTIAVTKGPIVAGQAAVGMLDIAITEAENAFLPYRVARESFNRIAESMGIGKIPSITERVGGKSVGQFMEENLGVKFEETHKIINTMLSPETQASMQRAQQALDLLAVADPLFRTIAPTGLGRRIGQSGQRFAFEQFPYDHTARDNRQIGGQAALAAKTSQNCRIVIDKREENLGCKIFRVLR